MLYEQKSQSLKITTIISFYIGVCVCVCEREREREREREKERERERERGGYIVLCYLGMLN